MENNQILEALAQVPNLVEATKKVVECNTTLMKQYSDLLAKRMEAEIPASEISKVTSAVANTVVPSRIFPMSPLLLRAASSGA